MTKKNAKSTEPNKVSKVVNISISVGDDDSERLLPEFVAAIKDALSGGDVNAKNITITGQHYLILNGGSGKLCREPDYDPATRDFRPGTFPPAWAGGGPETTRATRDIEAGIGVGARNPEHLRTVQETLAARAGKSVGKKLRKRSESATGDLGAMNTRSGKKTTASEPDEDIEIDLDAVDEGAESAAEEATSSLLLKLRRKR